MRASAHMHCHAQTKHGGLISLFYSS